MPTFCLNSNTNGGKGLFQGGIFAETELLKGAAEGERFEKDKVNYTFLITVAAGAELNVRYWIFFLPLPAYSTREERQQQKQFVLVPFSSTADIRSHLNPTRYSVCRQMACRKQTSSKPIGGKSQMSFVPDVCWCISEKSDLNCQNKRNSTPKPLNMSLYDCEIAELEG